MPLLRDGTVVRMVSRVHHQKPIGEASHETPPSYEVAPIEDVTRVVEGLNTTITFTFKVVEGEALQPPSLSKSGCLILCAEDNRVSQRVLGKLLSNFGQYFVMTANGQQAVEVYKSSPDRFPVIFMDLTMPIIDGHQATILIRAFEASRPGRRRSFIVGLVAYSTFLPASLSTLSLSGFDVLLHKPIRVNELYEMFLGGPKTNLIMLYGSLTEEEKSVYPRLVEKNMVLGDDPRSNAIKDELKKIETNDAKYFKEDVVWIPFTKVVVKVA